MDGIEQGLDGHAESAGKAPQRGQVWIGLLQLDPAQSSGRQIGAERQCLDREIAIDTETADVPGDGTADVHDGPCAALSNAIPSLPWMTCVS